MLRRAGVMALVSLVAGCGGTGAVSARVLSGVNVAAAENLPQPQFNQQLAVLRAEGVQIVRSDLPWALVQPLAPRPNHAGWRWARTDAWEAAFARHGLTWEPIIDYSVGWAKTCPGFCAPASNSTYAAFAEAVAARYGPRGRFWSEHPHLRAFPVRAFEIWNEENVPTYHVSPGRYASLYMAARQAIKRVDPGATVIVGGLGDDGGAYSPRQDYPSLYVRQLFASQPGLAGHVDGFGLHPYGASGPDVEQWTVHFRQTLDSLGEASAPIYVTEFGWPTGTSRGESWRAQQMSFLGTALTHSNCGVGLVAPYDWVNPGAVSLDDFGLAEAGAPSASGGARVVVRPAGIAWFRSLRERGSELRLCPQTELVHVSGQARRGARTRK